ncbi:uncharacterized protein LOC129921135 [Episyrphus balteatus]|uniref:uncharacterized protein LOC129921135 n=1 Tax=Episyrphus balteatus TaxID=286459 RepID=UPI002485D3AE|nr:uncharacterized protein LOC129921135 [Episyrphus balteatus]
MCGTSKQPDNTKMYTIDKLCCMDLPTGAAAYGWFSIFYSIITAIYSLFDANIKGIIWYTIIGVGVAVLLIIAVRQRSHILLLPWLGANAFQIVIITPIALIFIIWDNISKFSVLFFSLITLILLTAFLCYVWIGIYSLYLIFQSEKQTGTTRERV